MPNPNDNDRLTPPIPVACASPCRPWLSSSPTRCRPCMARWLDLVAHALAKHIRNCLYAMLANSPQLHKGRATSLFH
jgi:hypothetical protein